MSWAVVVGAVIGLAGTAYSVYDADKKADELEEKAEEEQLAASAMDKRIIEEASRNKSAKVEFGGDRDAANDYRYFLNDSPSDKKKNKKPSLGFGTADSGMQL